MFLLRRLFRSKKDKTKNTIKDGRTANQPTTISGSNTTAATKAKPTETLTKSSTGQPASNKATEPRPTDAVASQSVVSRQVTKASVSEEAPVRLLPVEEFVKCVNGVPFYEIVPTEAYIEVGFQEFLDKYWKETAVISWRWMNPKPSSKSAAIAALQTANPVPTSLVAYVKSVAQRNSAIRYVWLDWSCAPQYPEGDVAATMREINRSGAYYRKSAEIIVWCFNDVGEDEFTFSDYFGRAWTLSERLNRSRSDSYLRGTSVVPLPLTNAMHASGSGLRLKVATDTQRWEALCARELEGMKMHDRLSTDVVVSFVQNVIVRRYPLIDAAFTAMNNDPMRNGSLTQVLTAPVLALASTALMLRATLEWIRLPDPRSRTTISMNLGIDFDEFIVFVVTSIVQYGRMRINNLPDKSLSNSLEAAIGIEQGLRSIEERDGSLKKIQEHAARIYDLALEQRTLEVADEDWLARYLTYEIGIYQAFVEQDKLFAVYKLFDGVQDRAYDQVELVWRDLCVRVADRLKFMSASTYDEPWLSELSVVGSEQDVGRPFFGVNRRSAKDLPSSHPRNFGVLAYPKFNGGKSSVCSALCLPDLIEVPDLLTYVLGFKLDPATIVRLGKLQNFTLVNKNQGTEIDSHLSLRGRKALEQFESLLHANLTKCCDIPSAADPSIPFVSEHNGLFVCVRYDGRRNLSKVVLVRTSAVEPGEWTVEAVSCFTGEPQKGSSWGVAKCLDGLISDVLALGNVALACKQYGKCDPWSETVKLEKGENSGNTNFFDVWTLSLRTTPQVKSIYRPEFLPPAAEIEDDNVDDLMVIGKTTFDSQVEFARVRKAFRLAKKQKGGSGLNLYYQMLQRNYLVDTVMAQKIAYFGDLCELLTQQLAEFPAMLNAPIIKQFFDYLVEDMIDAIDMAEDKVDDTVLEKVRTQRRALMQAVEGDD